MRYFLYLLPMLALACSKRPANTTLSTLDRKAEPYDHLAFQRSWPEETFDWQGWLRAIDAVRAEERAAARSADPCVGGSSTPWTLQGPMNVAGRVNTLALHPDSDDVLLAGFSTGGLFKTTDGGVNWTPVFDDQPELSIGDITYDPQNPQVVYAGTGDPNMPGTVFNGRGLYKSTDGGDTWSYLALQQHGIISKVVVDHTNGQTLFVASMGNPFFRDQERGVYKSTDGGNTWTQVLFVSNQAGASDLVMHPDNPNILYASFWDRIRTNKESVVYGPHARVYKTTDGGNTWTQLGGGLPTGDMGRTGLAISQKNPDKLYALYVDTLSRPGGLFVTNDAGNTWAPVNIQSLNNAYADFGWYFGKVRIDPNNDDDVYFPAIVLWRKAPGQGSWQIGAGAHADVHDLVFGKTGRRYLACDGGVYRNEPGLVSWTKSANLPTTQCYRTTYNPNAPGTYFLGAQDNGIQKGNSQALNGWTGVFPADGFRCAFLPTNADTFWVEVQNGTIHRTDNGGVSWNFGQRALGTSDRVNWDMPFFLSKHRPELLYAATFRLYVSHVTGGWSAVSGDLTDGVMLQPRFHTVSTLSESPIVAELLFAGTSDGNVWRRSPNGVFTNISAGLPDRYVTSVVGSPTLPGRIFVTHSGYRDNDKVPHIHRSDNNGASWINISGNLPNVPVNAVFVVPQTADSAIVVATDAGVYFTRNGGQRWQRLGSNMPIIPVFDLEHNPAQRQLVAATFARGIWTFPLDSILVQSGQPDPVTLSGGVQSHFGIPLPGVAISASGGMGTSTGTDGQFAIGGADPCMPHTLSAAYQGDWLDGVSTFDLLLISRHILGLDTLPTPYRIIAADANRSGTVTTFDIVQLRRLILGIDTALTNNTSWRFLPASVDFPNPIFPFQHPWPDTLSVPPPGNGQDGLDFIGIKVGDVNGPGANNAAATEPRSRPEWLMEIKDTMVMPDAPVWCTVWGDLTHVAALQFTLQPTAGTTIRRVVPLHPPLRDGEHWHLDSSLRVCAEPGMWPEAGFVPLFRLEVGSNRPMWLSQMLGLGLRPTTPEAYGRSGERKEVALRWLKDHDALRVVIYPQPAGSAGVWFDVSAKQGLAFRCTVFDPGGRLVFDNRGVAGTPLHLPAERIAAASWYAFRIRMDDGREHSGRIVVAR